MMQIWSMDCTLKSWQVKTMCPVNPSDTEGEGIEPCPAVGLGEGRLGTGVAIESVTAGDEDEEEWRLAAWQAGPALEKNQGRKVRIPKGRAVRLSTKEVLFYSSNSIDSR